MSAAIPSQGNRSANNYYDFRSEPNTINWKKTVRFYGDHLTLTQIPSKVMLAVANIFNKTTIYDNFIDAFDPIYKEPSGWALAASNFKDFMEKFNHERANPNSLIPERWTKITVGEFANTGYLNQFTGIKHDFITKFVEEMPAIATPQLAETPESQVTKNDEAIEQLARENTELKKALLKLQDEKYQLKNEYNREKAAHTKLKYDYQLLDDQNRSFLTKHWFLEDKNRKLQHQIDSLTRQAASSENHAPSLAPSSSSTAASDFTAIHPNLLKPIASITMGVWVDVDRYLPPEDSKKLLQTVLPDIKFLPEEIGIINGFFNVLDEIIKHAPQTQVIDLTNALEKIGYLMTASALKKHLLDS